MKTEIEKASKPVVKNLIEGLFKIFSNLDNNSIAPFMKLFWEEQQKYINCHLRPVKASAAYKEFQYDF